MFSIQPLDYDLTYALSWRPNKEKKVNIFTLSWNLILETHIDQMCKYLINYYSVIAILAWPPLTPSPLFLFLSPSCLSHLLLLLLLPTCCAWLLLFDLCPRLQVGGAGVQSWPITIRASPSVTRPLWGWIMSRLPTAVSRVSGNLPNMDQWELKTESVGTGDEERYRRKENVRRVICRGLKDFWCISLLC